ANSMIVPAAAPGAAVFTNRLASTQGSAPSGVTIILLDTRNTRAQDQIYAKAQVIRYLRSLKPTDHIGIYTFGGGLKVLHDYTSDSSTMLQKLSTAKGWVLPDTSQQDAAGALQSDGAIFDDFSRVGGGTSAAERAFYTTDRVLSTLYAFEF